LIGHSTEEYLAIVLDLAKNPQRLEQLRAGLRERMKASPLMDAKRFTADIEAAYRQMWKTWCAAHPRRLMQGSSQ
jgi:predicted O-linked N-acetylglucosamine transferase (SPINDLY family)